MRRVLFRNFLDQNAKDADIYTRLDAIFGAGVFCHAAVVNLRPGTTGISSKQPASDGQENHENVSGRRKGIPSAPIPCLLQFLKG